MMTSQNQLVGVKHDENVDLPKISPSPRGGGGTWVFFGLVCAARDSTLAPRSEKNFP